MRIQNNVVVITGGSRGLGKSLAALLVSQGNTVVICARKEEKEELEQTAAEIGAVPYAADVTREDEVTALADYTVSSFGRIDIWINNAGVWMPHAPFQEMDMARIRELFAVNVFGVMYGARAALVRMRAEGGGTLVNIISVSALSGRPMSAGYAASKWAVRGFTDSIREENRDAGIRVIGVYPDKMRTHLFDEGAPEETLEYMTGESVAETIVRNLESEPPFEEHIIRNSSA